MSLTCTSPPPTALERWNQQGGRTRFLVVYEVARRKLIERLHELRLARGGSGEAPRNLADALRVVRAQIDEDPATKQRTKDDYGQVITRLLPGGDAELPAVPLTRLTGAVMRSWWDGCAALYAPQQANHCLMIARRSLDAARKLGSLVGDPTEDLTPMKIPRTRMNLLSREQFRALVSSVRNQPNASHRANAANWIEFQAYSGLRPGEMKALQWEHLDEAAGVIWVHGGSTGTKNRLSRPVPMIAEMRALIVRMKEFRGIEPLVFPRQPPRDALNNHCRRLGLPHMRIYDLRHMFATTCNESGVDVPTFAKWLGHRDGGNLAMRTYVHPNDEHSARSAAKVSFAS